MEKREFSMMRTDVRRLGGQLATGPTGVDDQSRVRMSAPSSPPPATMSSAVEGGAWESVDIVENLNQVPGRMCRVRDGGRDHPW